MPWTVALTSLVGPVPAVGRAGAARADAGPALAEVAAADALAAARWVDRVGPAPVLDRLGDDARPVVERLVAVRAAPFLDEATVAVPALVSLATSRDPDLAPEAVAALLDVARARRSAAVGPTRRDAVADAVSRMRVAADDPALRRDLAASLRAAAEMLAPGR